MASLSALKRDIAITLRALHQQGITVAQIQQIGAAFSHDTPSSKWTPAMATWQAFLWHWFALAWSWDSAALRAVLTSSDPEALFPALIRTMMTILTTFDPALAARIRHLGQSLAGD